MFGFDQNMFKCESLRWIRVLLRFFFRVHIVLWFVNIFCFCFDYLFRGFFDILCYFDNCAWFPLLCSSLVVH